ncbi:nucleoside ABC transporter membrane protein [Bellilinea caldifistulae]|uniref:Ribose ABC transporter permease n=1 Tax=Bellilinea caldifistulae TaxID=360411 RepID=A0A0P6X2F6_9CHLR|nr:ABC transporter permease [Bellilinea caldifistulae]KPL75187.1 ribose ABC transporter permease [Bellilinea caldifistulae]GAP09308.1 nucleoside ABC transporter membrane protein [Bellilinea caldifistulae]
METLITFLRLVLLSMVPFVLASQGTMLGGRTGIFNVAQEGIMLLGASLGFLVSYQVGNNFVGMLAAMAAGAVFGLLLAYFTTTLKMNQFFIGLSLFFIGVGLSTLLPKLIIGITLSPPLIPTLPEVSIPLLSQIPLLGPILFRQNGLVYFSIVLSLLLWYFLYRTQRGLELRAVGENPMTADSLGINVVRARYWTAILGGALIGLAGAYLPMVYTGTFTEAMTRGRGWLAIALTFFGGWSPLTILTGSLFFAGVEVLAFRAQVIGLALPYQYLLMVPYLATILIMILTFRKARVPAFLGQNYDREKRNL